MASDDFYITNSWMIEDLGLSGVELQCFAIIWSLSRGKKQMYTAGNSHLVKMTKKTKQTIITTLKSLCKKGYIKKVPTKVNNIEYNYYKAIKEGSEKFSEEEEKEYSDGSNNYTDGSNNYTDTGQKVIPPNKESNKESNNKEKNSLSNDKQKDELFEKFWADYGKKGAKARALKEWNRLKDKEKQLVMKNLPEYLIYCKRKQREMKDASSYLHQEYYAQDWNIIPDYYQIHSSDNERLVKFKQYMVDRFKDLIYHRNPLTFEQTEELINDLGLTEFESVMDKLAQRDIHQYFSIFKGVEAVLNEEE